MTYLDVYVGHCSDASIDSEPRDGWSEDLPQRLSPNFPPCSDKNVFIEIRDRISTGRMRGRQIDWGAWVAVVTKAEVQAFVLEMYGTKYNPKGMPHLSKRYEQLTESIEAMVSETSYVLVASES